MAFPEESILIDEHPGNNFERILVFEMRPSSSEVEEDKRASEGPSNGRVLRNTPSRRNRFKPYSRRLFPDSDDVRSAPSTSTTVPSCVLPEPDLTADLTKPAAAMGDVSEKVQWDCQCEQNSEKDVNVDPKSEEKRTEMRLKMNQNNGKPTFWCFLLRQLMDPSKREIVAWTGRGREFRIRDENRLAELWCEAQGRKKLANAFAFRRHFYRRYAMDVFLPVDRQARQYSWQIEPSAYVNMTSSQVDDYIRQYSDNSPTAARKQVRTKPATVSSEAQSTVSNPYAPRDTVTGNVEKSVLIDLLPKPSPCPPNPAIDTVTPKLLVPEWPSFSALIPYYGTYPYCYQPEPPMYAVPENTATPTSFHPLFLPWFSNYTAFLSPDPFSNFPVSAPLDAFWYTSDAMRQSHS